MPPPSAITHDGTTDSLRGWSGRTGLPVYVISQRLRVLGWPAAKALTAPISARHRRRGGRFRAGEVRPCPRLKPHKASGQAFCRWRAGGRDRVKYFGRWGEAATQAAYRRFQAEWAAGTHDAPRPGEAFAVADLLAGWVDYCSREFRKRGRETSEAANCRTVAAAVREQYGDMPAAGFGPAQLRAVRELWVARGLGRNTVNAYCARIVRAWRWATGESLIPPGIASALADVAPLRPGRTLAPERPRRKPADPAAVAAALAHLRGRPARVAAARAAVTLQQLTGMRPAEVCHIRPCDIDRAGEVWVYAVDLDWNKNAHRGRPQRYYLGPRAQAILSPLLEGRGQGERVFPFDRQGYSLTIKLAVRAAECERWTPHQLRHALATAVAERTGSIQAAADAIGDTPATAAKHYVHLDPRERAKREIAREMG
jgi:integrase